MRQIRASKSARCTSIDTIHSYTYAIREYLVWLPEVEHSTTHVFVRLGDEPRHVPLTPLGVVHGEVRVHVVHRQTSIDRYLTAVRVPHPTEKSTKRRLLSWSLCSRHMLAFRER